MLESPAYRRPESSAHRVLDRIEIELAHHGGQDNGKLPVTFDDFVSYGIHRHAVAPAVRELEALGFIRVTERGRAGNAEFRSPNKFAMTYRRRKTPQTPTTGSTSPRLNKPKRSPKRRENQSKNHANEKQNPSAGKRHFSVTETGTENQNLQ